MSLDEGGQTVAEAVQVAVRVRPFSSQELSAGPLEPCVAVSSQNRTVCVTQRSGGPGDATLPTYPFDSVLWSMAGPDQDGGAPVGQADVYARVGAPLVQHAFDGYNACLFAYGQTGSGKTHTMMGSDADPGVIPRLCADLFSGRVGHTDGSRWDVQCGYLEVYNERVADLLAAPKKRAARGGADEQALEVRDHGKAGPFVVNQTWQAVTSLDEVLTLIAQGNERRRTAATKMNDRSSRSHAIFQLRLQEFRAVDLGDGQRNETRGKFSKINLVDLAGSERVSQSKVVGKGFDEAKFINMSLLTLGRVIDKLADGKGEAPPYRESKLTFLLKDCLGGNAKTCMVATVSPAETDLEQTRGTLRYASRAREITAAVTVNEDPKARRIRELMATVAALTDQQQGADSQHVQELEAAMANLRAEAHHNAGLLHAAEAERAQAAAEAARLMAAEADKERLRDERDSLARKLARSSSAGRGDADELAAVRAAKERAESEKKAIESAFVAYRALMEEELRSRDHRVDTLVAEVAALKGKLAAQQESPPTHHRDPLSDRSLNTQFTSDGSKQCSPPDVLSPVAPKRRRKWPSEKEMDFDEELLGDGRPTRCLVARTTATGTIHCPYCSARLHHGNRLKICPESGRTHEDLAVEMGVTLCVLPERKPRRTQLA